MWLWNPGFPGKVNTMTIQNCEDVRLYTGNEFSKNELESIQGPFKIEFTRLELINISNLNHLSTKEPRWRRVWSDDHFEINHNITFAEKSRYVKESKKCSLKETIFENIRYAYISHSFLPHCQMETVKFFKMNNVLWEDNDISMNPTDNVEIKFCNFNQIRNAFRFSKLNEVSK